MKLLRISQRRALLLLLAVSILPAALWSLALCIAPTEWAKVRLIAAMEKSTGRKVSVGSLRLGLLGNVVISDLSLAEVDNPSDPWLRTSKTRLDLHVVQMLLGFCTPTDIAIDGLDLRIHRRIDGILEFATLLESEPRSMDVESQRTRRQSKPVSISIRRARVVVVDEPSGTKLDFTEAEGKASRTDELALVESFKARLNGGTIDFAARYDRVSPAFEAEARLRDVLLGVGMESLGWLVPVVNDVARTIDGNLDLNLTMRGHGGTIDEIKSNLVGHGAIKVEPIDLSGSKLLDTLDALKHIPRSARVGSVESHFAVAHGRVMTDDLTVKVARIPLLLSGWTAFDGQLEYSIRTDQFSEKFAGKLPSEARTLLSEVKQEFGDLAAIRIMGTVDAPRLEAVGPGGTPSRDLDRERLREAARKLGAKVLR